jgi:branched-chain amino acid transport system ATP-binding protein
MLRRRAGSLSGGEQQMLTLGRALARRPRLLLCDELSLGLAPLVVKRLLSAVRAAADEHGLGALLVEQQVNQVLRFADRAYVLRRGELVLSGPAHETAQRMNDLEDLYL